MVIIISGDTHTGKTFLAQKLLEKYQIPYLSIDHLKMGLIRSGYTTLNPESPWKDLTEYLWPVLEGIIKTNIENKQNIIIEGSYIPYDYKKYFNEDYLKEIKIVYLIFSEKYIHTNFDLIDKKSSIIENRISDNLNKEELILNANVIKRECKKHGIDYILIDENYDLSEIMDQVDCKL